MRYSICLLAVVAATAAAQETVIGAYIWSRHGDRTAKSTPPVDLTDLGYLQAFTSGTYFRNRYVASGATRKLFGIRSDIIYEPQLAVSAPFDVALQNSATAFMQGMYPPVGTTLGTSTLRNGATVQAPLNGYQLVPVGVIATGANNENAGWLQSGTNCGNAQLSSNSYFQSQEYVQTFNRSQPLYDSIRPMVNRTFTASQTTFRNGYVIWDLLNVANIHNTTFPSSELLTPDTFANLRYLADQHEFGLAYNNSDPIRAVTGSIMASEVVTALNTTITSKGASKLTIQFGAYAGMLSFFGLANLTSVNSDFFGVPDYASTLTFELVTNATVSNTSFPTPNQISVRFLFRNGTTSNASEPIEYPLFNSNRSPLPWAEFQSGMLKFAITSQRQWCTVCGNSTGACSPASLDGTSGPFGNSSASGNDSGSGSSGLSTAAAGVVGAVVTLAVVLASMALLVLLGGFRLVSKKKLAAARAGNDVSPLSSVPGRGRHDWGIDKPYLSER